VDLELTGKVALVTGAGRGIGAAVARGLAREGCDVALVDRDDSETVAGEVRSVGRRALALRADVSRLAAAEESVARVAQELGRLDILVCNAGITRDAVIWKMTEEAWDEVLAVNLKGCFTFCRAVVPAFRSQRSGKIVTVASINGMRGKFGQSNYAASKAGVIALTRSLARELGAFGVNVNCVAPGMVRTAMTATLPPEAMAKAIEESPLRRVSEPDDVAQTILFLCSDRARNITGEVIKVDSGQYM
jgi:3-oxoacyl-[acyl-carrier protein] reductase